MVYKLKKPDWLTNSRIVIGVIIILLAIAMDPSLNFTRLMNWLGAAGFVGSLILLVLNKNASTKLLAALILSMSLVVYTTGIISWRTGLKPIPIAYQVVAEEDLALNETKRFVLHVVVSEPATVEQLQQVAARVVDEFPGENVGALRLQFYDHEEYVGLEYPLGYAIYAPNGLWNQASTVATGQSGPMRFAWHLLEKDWTLRLSALEAVAVMTWHQHFADYTVSADPHLDEAEISQQVAVELSLQQKEVEGALTKFERWIDFSD